MTTNARWNILYFLWILVLFRPEWLLSYLIPPFVGLRAAPTVFLLLLIFVWISSRCRRHGYLVLGMFLLSVLLSSFLAENTGRTRDVLRVFVEMYFLAQITFSFADDRARIEKLMNLYMLSFLYIGLWGILGFLATGRGIVVWDYLLNEEDAYGPLMCMGLAFGFKYYQALDTGRMKNLALLTSFICSLGVILSFARAAFVALLFVAAYLAISSGRAFRNAFVFGTVALACVVSVSVFVSDISYVEEIKSISEGFSSGTGRDRKVLMSIAWEEFKERPIIGFGPMNFGVVAGQFLLKVPDRRDYRVDTIWGRALHNGYFQILCELGMVGMIIFLLVLADFFRSNRNVNLESGDSSPPRLDDASLGFRIAMWAFLINAFFYDIIFYNWFFILLILNRLLVINLSREDESRRHPGR